MKIAQLVKVPFLLINLILSSSVLGANPPDKTITAAIFDHPVGARVNIFEIENNRPILISSTPTNNTDPIDQIVVLENNRNKRSFLVRQKNSLTTIIFQKGMTTSSYKNFLMLNIAEFKKGSALVVTNGDEIWEFDENNNSVIKVPAQFIDLLKFGEIKQISAISENKILVTTAQNYLLTIEISGTAQSSPKITETIDLNAISIIRNVYMSQQTLSINRVTQVVTDGTYAWLLAECSGPNVMVANTVGVLIELGKPQPLATLDAIPTQIQILGVGPNQEMIVREGLDSVQFDKWGARTTLVKNVYALTGSAQTVPAISYTRSAIFDATQKNVSVVEGARTLDKAATAEYEKFKSRLFSGMRQSGATMQGLVRQVNTTALKYYLMDLSEEQLREINLRLVNTVFEFPFELITGTENLPLSAEYVTKFWQAIEAPWKVEYDKKCQAPLLKAKG